MGWLDFLRGGDEPSVSQIQKAIKQVTQPHGDAAVRMSAADRLKAWGTPEATAGLLRRFTVQTPSGQLDQEECEQVEAMLVDLGEIAVAPILAFVEREAKVSLAARALEQIVPREQFVDHILGVLERLEAGFGSHNAQRENLIRALEDVDDPRIAPAVSRFLNDPTDDVALVALQTVVSKGGPEFLDSLVDLFEASSDRPRVREGVAEQLVAAGWPLREQRKRVEAILPAGFAIDKKGRVVSV